MADIINIQRLDPDTLEFQNYSSSDQNLIVSNTNRVSFNPNKDIIEYLIFDITGKTLFEYINNYNNLKK